MRAQGWRGYTLVELLYVLLGISFLLAIAPSFVQILDDNRQRSQLLELGRLINYARTLAVMRGQIITLCGSEDQVHCAQQWSAPTILVFRDSDNDRALGDGEMVFARTDLLAGRWFWLGSAHRPILRFRADGSAIEWGRFVLCPPRNAAGRSVELVLNRVGRTYTIRRAAGEANPVCTG